ncbi:hypothetical protein HYH02_005079 [Chlamydomonas schloesseri]|uniref:Uncharacterized protein n=1 Tax=Chlamydomonas schloesseri TaxID=2026947 RepID=A0A836B8E7_9CHLO|nr:hypothetical protein HYH02_005079 [Chlamydomonas schloesseri]|eukprot:KAG2450578.1 hypothetical protein HYH02_005079 [Chlamydomonas schloesseri]
MGTNTGVEIRIGWEESEQKEFLKAIRQPLMVQTPLQLVVEQLFQRIQSQAAYLNQMKEKMERIAVKDMTADELLERIKLLESKQGEAAGPKLDPFNQQEILSRLEALENKLADQAAARSEWASSGEGMADVESRLARLEARLSGVYNLNGKLLALEQIAGGLGVPVPDLEFPTGGGPPQAAVPQLQLPGWRPPTAPDAAAEAGAQPQADELWPSATKLGVAPRGASAAAGLVGGGLEGSTASAAPTAPGAAQGSGQPSTTGVAPTAAAALPRVGSPAYLSPRSLAAGTAGGAAQAGPSRLASMMGAGGASMAAQAIVGGLTAGGGAASPTIAPIGAGIGARMAAELAAVRTENEVLREGVERLGQQVASLRSGLGSNAVESLSRLQAVEEGVSGLQAQVAELAAAARAAAGRTGSEVTFADLNLVKSSVEGLAAEQGRQAAALAAVTEHDLPTLAARLEEVAEGLKKGGEPRDMDTLFHERLNGLEAALGDVRTELKGALEERLEGAPTLEDLQALEEALESRASAEALRQLQLRTHALGQAVAGVSDTLALRPELGDQLRNAAQALGTGGGGGGGGGGGSMGPIATKLRCLTCDQPVPAPGSGGGAGGKQGSKQQGGSFLPRLESMPGAREGPPVGPGLGIAELRASKEERLAGLAVGGNTGPRGGGGGGGGGTLKLGDLDDYANGTGLSIGGVRGSSPGRDGSPGRQVAAGRAARVPVGGKAGNLGHGSKPVFL